MFCVVQDLIWDFTKVITGWDITMNKWCTEQGPRIVTLQRAQLLLGGPDIFWDPDKDDDNPPRFYEPLPTGPYKGMTTDKKVVEQKKQEYYNTLGWDDRGIPKKETLEKLDLKVLEGIMKKLRK
jgi:aldehyde:ferredoxin oxidoreductase